MAFADIEWKRLDNPHEPKTAVLVELREADLTHRNDEELGGLIRERYRTMLNFQPGARYLRFEVQR